MAVGSVENSEAIKSAQKMYQEAEARGDSATMKIAHQLAQAARAGAGYTADASGSNYTSPGSAWGGAIGSALGSISGPLGSLAGRFIGSKLGNNLVEYAGKDTTSTSTKEKEEEKELKYPKYPQLQMRPVKSQAQAQQEARDILLPGINENTKIIVDLLGKNALKRGFFDQLPTYEFERATRADLAAKGEASIAQLASQMVGQDEAAAQREMELGLQQQNQLFNQKLAELNLQSGSEEAAANRQLQTILALLGYQADEDKYKYESPTDKALKEAQTANLLRSANAPSRNTGSSGTVNDNTAAAMSEIQQLLAQGKTPTQVLSMITEATPNYTQASVKTQTLRDFVYQSMGYENEAAYNRAVKAQQEYDAYKPYSDQLERDIRDFMDQTGATYDQARKVVLEYYS